MFKAHKQETSLELLCKSNHLVKPGCGLQRTATPQFREGLHSLAWLLQITIHVMQGDITSSDQDQATNPALIFAQSRARHGMPQLYRPLALQRETR